MVWPHKIFEIGGNCTEFALNPRRSNSRRQTDASLYDLTIQARLLKRDGTMEIMKLPYKGEFNVKLRFVQTQ